MRKWLSTGLSVVAVAGATVANPAAGIALGSSLLAGGVAKKAGKRHEARGGRPLHKATAPAAAVIAPAALAPLIAKLGLDPVQVCAALDALRELVCTSEAAAGAAVGIGGTLVYTVARAALALTGRD